MNNIKFVLDTNVLLVSLPTKSKYRPIFEALISGKYDIVVSNEVITEYREIIEQKTNAKISSNVIELLLSLNNIHKVDIYYKWNLITIDPDDNKFIDTCIAGRATSIVTNDKHFNVLRKIDFPKVDVLNIDEFLKMVIEL